MDEIEKIKKRLKKEIEENMEIDESDIPVHERYAKEEHIKKARKKLSNENEKGLGKSKTSQKR